MRHALRVLLKALLYTAVLPIFGFVIFGILTIVPLLGLFLGPYLLLFIYAAGGVPCAVTALSFEIWFRQLRFARSLLFTSMTGALSTLVWAIAFGGVGSRWSGGALYVVFALALSGALTAMIIPLVHRAFANREPNPYSFP